MFQQISDACANLRQGESLLRLPVCRKLPVHGSFSGDALKRVENNKVLHVGALQLKSSLIEEMKELARFKLAHSG